MSQEFVAREERDDFTAESSSLLTTAWQLDAENHGYGQEVTEIIYCERAVPVNVSLDQSLRPKIIDACGLSCTFCHNEGTPVATDNTMAINLTAKPGKSGRVSVFSETNGVDFIPGKMLPDYRFKEALSLLREGLDLKELHLTGGEPSLHTQLPALITAARETGYRVKMTSNGERGSQIIPECAEAGLEKIVFSIFGTTPAELAAVQHDRYKDFDSAKRKIDALQAAITSAADNGIETAANIVMPDVIHANRVLRVINEYDQRLSVRILPDIDRGSESYYAIYQLLARMGAVATDSLVEAGSSNARVRYKIADDREVIFKQIRPARLHETCSDCQFNNPDDCKEGFYGVRLYVDKTGQYQVGVCIQRMDLTMPVEQFITSGLFKEVKEMREQDLKNLQAAYNEAVT